MQPDADPEGLATWRAQVLDAQVAGRQVRPPPGLRAACTAWLTEMAPPDLPAALGVGNLPEAWIDTLGWCGMPLAVGPLRWGVDLEQADVTTPVIRKGRLLLPPPGTLAGLTSLSLKPLRLFINERLGCRLQAAPGIRMWLWPGRAVLQSLSPIPLAGFIYGSSPGHRAGLALEPWDSQLVTW
jgi:hypothetical protein